MLMLENICAMTSTVLWFQYIVHHYNRLLPVSIRISRGACQLAQYKDYGVFAVEDALRRVVARGSEGVKGPPECHLDGRIPRARGELLSGEWRGPDHEDAVASGGGGRD